MTFTGPSAASPEDVNIGPRVRFTFYTTSDSKFTKTAFPGSLHCDLTNHLHTPPPPLMHQIHPDTFWGTVTLKHLMGHVAANSTVCTRSVSLPVLPSHVQTPGHRKARRATRGRRAELGTSGSPRLRFGAHAPHVNSPPRTPTGSRPTLRSALGEQTRTVSGAGAQSCLRLSELCPVTHWPLQLFLSHDNQTLGACVVLRPVKAP